MPSKPLRRLVETKFAGKQTVNTIIKRVYFRKAPLILSSPVTSLFPASRSVLCVCIGGVCVWGGGGGFYAERPLRSIRSLSLWRAPFRTRGSHDVSFFFSSPSSIDVTVWLHRHRVSHTSIAPHLRTATQKKRSVDVQSESRAAILNLINKKNK